jgi:hypothetical protein
MNCACDWDPPSVYRCAEHTAGTPQVCSECGATIAPGECYEHLFGIWEGVPDCFDTCRSCRALRDWIAAHVPCVCWQHGNLHDDCIQAAEHWAHHAPGLLFGTLRRAVLIQRHARSAQP